MLRALGIAYDGAKKGSAGEPASPGHADCAEFCAAHLAAQQVVQPEARRAEAAAASTAGGVAATTATATTTRTRCSVVRDPRREQPHVRRTHRSIPRRERTGAHHRRGAAAISGERLKRTSFARRFADVELPTGLPVRGALLGHLGRRRRRMSQRLRSWRSDPCRRVRAPARRRRRVAAAAVRTRQMSLRWSSRRCTGANVAKGAAAARRARRHLAQLRSEDEPPSSPRRLLVDYARPSAVADPEQLLRTNQIQFYMGPTGGGAQPHCIRLLGIGSSTEGRSGGCGRHAASYAAYVSTWSAARRQWAAALRCTQRAGDVLVSRRPGATPPSMCSRASGGRPRCASTKHRSWFGCEARR